MYGRLGINVSEGVGEIIFIELLRRDDSGNNFAEDAVHPVRITQCEQVSESALLHGFR